MLTTDDLVRLKMAMEFGAMPRGDELPPVLLNVEDHPRMIASRAGDGHRTFFRHDVPQATRQRLLDLGAERLMTDEAAVRAILETDAPVEHIWRVSWYTIQRMPEPDEYPNVVVRDGRHVIVADGKVVAFADTAADNERAAEVEVETDAAYRRRGYARQVVASWAAVALRSGKAAYYSHNATNDASRAVARSLGLTFLSEEIEYL